MSTITITLLEEQKPTKLEIDLPYYAKENGRDAFWAIRGENNNLYVHTYSSILPHIFSWPAKNLSSDHTRITEQDFSVAFDKAMSQLNAKRAEACPNIL
jgi:hypothetical protein